MSEPRTGRCLCGAVTFKAIGVKTDHAVCHCSMCRRWAGSPLFAAHVEGVEFDGEENLGLYTSSDWAERGFCRICGTNLFYRLREGGETHASVGAFDDQSDFKLVSEIFVDAKPGGYAFAGDLKQMTEADVLALYAPPASDGE